MQNIEKLSPKNPLRRALQQDRYADLLQRLSSLGITQREVARQLNVSPQRISSLRRQKVPTPEVLNLVQCILDLELSKKENHHRLIASRLASELNSVSNH